MFRKRGRTALRCAIQMTHEQIGNFQVVTRNVSATGMFIDLESPDNKELLDVLSVGDVLQADVESLYEQSEKLEMRIMRRAKDGIGLSFAEAVG